MKNPNRKLENIALLVFILGAIVAAAGVFIQEYTGTYQMIIVGGAIATLGYAALGALYLRKRL